MIRNKDCTSSSYSSISWYSNSPNSDDIWVWKSWSIWLGIYIPFSDASRSQSISISSSIIYKSYILWSPWWYIASYSVFDSLSQIELCWEVEISSSWVSVSIVSFSMIGSSISTWAIIERIIVNKTMIEDYIYTHDIDWNSIYEYQRLFMIFVDPDV
jgi:hypothetical protein